MPITTTSMGEGERARAATHRHREPRRGRDATDPRRARARRPGRRGHAHDRPAHPGRAARHVRARGRRGGVPRRRPAGTAASPYLDFAAAGAGAASPARADAAWVGWGFVAERPEFVELCDRLGVTFIGPTADGDAQARRQDRRQAAGRAGRGAGGRRGAAAPVDDVDVRAGARRADRLPADDQGHAPAAAAAASAWCTTRGRAGRGVRERPVRGGPRRSATRRCSWSAGRRRPAHRGADHRRRPRHRLGRSACGTAASSAATRR